MFWGEQTLRNHLKSEWGYYNFDRIIVLNLNIRKEVWLTRLQRQDQKQDKDKSQERFPFILNVSHW